MKKIALILLLVCLAVGTVAAETPKYFSINLGGMYSYDMPTDKSGVSTPFGLQFQVNEMFSAGFAFFTNAQLVNVSISPIKNSFISFYTGKYDANGVAGGDVGFGVGAGYDFATNNSKMFSSLGIYMDWLANNDAAGSAGSIEDGGVFMIGLKAKLGL